MKMKKKYKILLIMLVLILLAGAGFLTYKYVLNPKPQDQPITNVAKVTNKIEGYDYTLEDRDTDLFKSLFEELKQNLESQTPNEEEYIKSVSKLFITDLYTISNKVSKYDIGGLEYLISFTKESFRSKVLDTLYKTVEDDSYKTRNQELPTIATIEVKKATPSTYKLNNQDTPAYEISLSWTYEKNLGYDQNGIVTIIKEADKWSVISYQPTK